MKKLLSIAGCLFLLLTAKAQGDSIKRQKTFITVVRTTDNKLIKGRLLAVNDSQLVLNSSNVAQPVLPESIQSFTLKRKNSALKGALIGLGVGAVTGIVIGLASGDDPVMQYPDANNDPYGIGSIGVVINNAFALSAGEKAVAGGILLGTGGAIVGTLIGVLAKKKFIIGGKKEVFHDLQSELMLRLVKK